MKRLLWAMALLLLLPLFACAEAAPKKLTLMVYMCGSNLESQNGAAGKDILEMLASGYDMQQVDILLMTGGSKSWSLGFPEDKVCIYTPFRKSVRMETAYESASMGEAGTLATFLNYGYTEHPAEKYALILWDHGGGPLEGVCYDELYDSDSLTITELVAALENSPAAETPLEWIGFDACLMASAENALSLAPFADYMIASENTEPANGWNYSFLNGIEKDADGAATGRRIVDSYFDTDAADDRTLACIDLSAMAEVGSAMDAFFGGLQVDNSNYAMYAYGVRHSTAFGRAASDANTLDLVDLGSLLQLLRSQSPQAAQTLDGALQRAVVYQRSNGENRTGLTVYHPYYNRGAYLSRWGGEYQQNSPLKGYADYTTRFAAYLFGEAGLSWSNLSVAVAADGTGFVLPLSEEQMENLASATMHILQWDDASETYSPVYATGVAVDGQELAASWSGSRLVLKGTEISVPFTLREDGSLLIYVNYMNGDTDLSIPGEAARISPFDTPVPMTQATTQSYSGDSGESSEASGILPQQANVIMTTSTAQTGSMLPPSQADSYSMSAETSIQPVSTQQLSAMLIMPDEAHGTGSRVEITQLTEVSTESFEPSVQVIELPDTIEVTAVGDTVHVCLVASVNDSGEVTVTETLFYDEASGTWTTRRQADLQTYATMVFPTCQYKPDTEGGTLSGFSAWQLAGTTGEAMEAQAAPEFSMRDVQGSGLCVAFELVDIQGNSYSTHPLLLDSVMMN